MLTDRGIHDADSGMSEKAYLGSWNCVIRSRIFFPLLR